MMRIDYKIKEVASRVESIDRSGYGGTSDDLYKPIPIIRIIKGPLRAALREYKRFLI